MGDPLLLEVGHIDRAHGLRGEVIVTLITDRTERVEAGAVLHSDAGSLRVRGSRPHQHRWIVVFEGITTREGAEGLRGTTLRAEPFEDEGDGLWVHRLIGAEVVGVDGRTWGPVASVEANPASDLLVLRDGALVPMVFVVDESGLPGRLVIDPPDGLLDGQS